MLDITQIDAFVQSSPHPAWLTTRNGNCVYANAALERLTGLKSAQIEQADWRSFVLDDDRAEATKSWERSVATGTPYRTRIRIRGFNGVPAAVELIAFGRKVSDGMELWWFTGLHVHGATQQYPRLEALLQATLNVIPAHTWYALPSGALSFVNERSADYLGLPKHHPLCSGSGTGAAWDSFLQFVHANEREEARKVWSTCLRTGCAGEMSLRVRNSEGGYQWFLSRAEPLRASDGTLLYWIGVNLEIDERKRAEENLRRSEAYLNQAQHLSHTGSFGCKPSSGEMLWSEETFRIFGYDHTTTPQVGAILQRVHPEDRAGVAAQIARATSEGKDCDLEYRLLLPDDSIKHVHVVAHAVKDESGRLEFVGAVTDVTERKRAEQEIREREAEIRQVLDLTPQLVAVFGPSRERLYANRVALDYVGLSLEEWRQAPGEIFRPGWYIHPDDRERATQAHSDSTRSSGSAYELELRVQGADGSYRWFLVRFNPVRDEHGRILRWYVAATDIDERKRAEEKLQQENVALREEINKASMFEEIVGGSAALDAALSRVAKVAPTDSTVLITGETGTGKELVARAIHRSSNRSGAFVSVNCAAIPRDLIASELFGHEKGAFTGAAQRRLGRFEMAEGGTIFLDEAGELPAETQIALLRVLQEHEFERVGGGRPIPSDVRVIAATNRDLHAAIAAGSFRSDLFYRLNVFPIEVPPLRERKGDIPLLVEYFVDRYARKIGKKIRHVNKKTLDLLQSYPWPGNIRELQNVIERSVIVSETETLSIDECWISRQPAAPHSKCCPDLAEKLALQEKEMIEDALRESCGRVYGPSGAAAKLGMPRSTVEFRIRSLKINKNQFKS